MEKRVQKRSSITILLVVLFVCIVSLAVLFAVPLAGKTEGGAKANAATAPNNLRTAEDGKVPTSDVLQGWTFAVTNEVQGYAFRPEHGDTVFYTYYKEGVEEYVGRLAIYYTRETSTAAMRFYEVAEEGGVLTRGELISAAQDYLYTYHYTLKAGKYRLEVSVPQIESTGSHRHWFEDDEVASDNGVTYPALTSNFTFTIASYELNANSYTSDPNLHVEFPEAKFIAYSGKADGVVRPVITLYNKVLVENEDYELSTSSVDVGTSPLTIKGINSLEGAFTIEDAFTIIQASNGWSDVPSIWPWAYNTFDRAINLISAEPEFGRSAMWFSISRDEEGEDLIGGLEHITLDENGQVPAEAAEILKALHAGEYYLCGFVDETDNYEGLSPKPIGFRVFVATNRWEVAPSVNSWTEGEFDLEEERIVASAVYGSVHILIVDDKETVYFDSDNEINILSEAKPGRYTLTAYVDAADDYYGLDVYTVVFEVFKKPALPWWATMSIVVGAVAAAALVIFILWKQGVFQILTEKIVVSARTHATVDATLAYIRASKKMEEGKQSVEEAKRREREAEAAGKDTASVSAEGKPQGSENGKGRI